MDKINITDVQAAETNLDWYDDGEIADQLVLNRPIKQVATFVNDIIDAIEPPALLTAIKTVDGTSSGLDADLLDGQHGSYFQPAATAVKTTTTFGGDVSGTYNNLQVTNDSHTHNSYNLTGNTLATGILYSSLTSVGTLSGCNISGTLAVTGNITVTGTVDGRDVLAMGQKLDTIESGATADQTAAEILNLIKTVDGTNSGLDADRLRGWTFNWSGQAGQPGWVWGGNDGVSMYVWNPSNFSVNYANSAGYASSAGNADTVDGWHASSLLNQSLGYGQSWQLPGRAANTTYYNTTGRPIFVSIGAGLGGSNVVMYINGVAVTRSAESNTSYIGGVVPTGGSYSITTASVISQWAELR